MRERDGFPPGVPCWIDSAQPDPGAAVAFYGGLFGWDFEDRMPAGGPGQYFVARLRGRDVAAIGSQFGGGPVTPVWSTYIWVDDMDAAAAKVADAGGQVPLEPFAVLDAGRMAVCADPAGAVFDLWQPGTHRGAQLVNEPGSWNRSDLVTDDIEGARAFYGAVFGWEARGMDLGGSEGWMWRRPGYADFLEGFDPDLRRRHAEFGAPEGFSDAIGWMLPLSADQRAFGTRPHWSVTFAVDDADAIADRTTALGGTVIVPPHNADGARIAGLRDPQGAVFSVSRFGPTG